MKREGTTEADLVLTDAQFQLLRDLIHRQFGINLGEQKRSLLFGRLRKLIAAKGLASFQAYYDHVVADASGEELGALVDHISTNHTFFNRESEHFDYFSGTVLPEARERARQKGVKELRVWCAAASTGEEPYMLAMLMQEGFDREYPLWDAGLLATDISDRALSIARAGVYAAERMQGLPPALMRKYFKRVGADHYEAALSLRKEITFRRFNLMNPSFPFRKPFDAIFCRNVMIYFDPETKRALAGKLHDVLRPGGHLFTGLSETLGRDNQFEYLGPGIYRRCGPC